MKLEIEYIGVDELTPYENNTRKHGKEDVEEIKKSIEKYGFDDPIGVWGGANLIVEGHGRLMAAKELGMDKVPIIRLDHLTDEQRREYAIMHNRTAELSEWDFEKLDAEMRDLQMEDFDLKIDGYIPDIEKMKQEAIEDEIPDEILTRCHEGDIWVLGEHRLICGDSTSSENAKRLLGDEKAKMLFTSPPYADMREYRGGKDLSVANIAKFISTFKPYTDYQCVNLGLQRKDHELIQYWDEYIKIAKESGYKLMAWNVWDKMIGGSIGQQNAFIPIRHEWIFVFGTEYFDINPTWKKKDESIEKRGEKRNVRQPDGSMKASTKGDTSKPLKKMESVLELESVTKLIPEKGSIIKHHPATFPVGLPMEYIKAMSKEGDIIIEPFGGAGTTLIACEQLGRKCRISELDAHYCDVILQRWETFTGKKAEKVK